MSIMVEKSEVPRECGQLENEEPHPYMKVLEFMALPANQRGRGQSCGVSTKAGEILQHFSL